VRIQGALIDLDGTIYRGDAPVAGAPAAIDRLVRAGIEPVFLSNNATKRPETYREKLRSFGIEASGDQILTSASITADHLARHHPDKSVYVLGEEPLLAELTDRGLDVTDEPARAEAILASLYRSFDYGSLEDVLAADRTGEPHLFATNPDRTCPVDAGEIPDCRAVIGAIEGLLDREVTVLGKPSRTTIDVALERIHTGPEQCLMIGDRLETDIAMGEKAGMVTVLVLSGVTDPEELAEADVTPDHCLDSIADIADVLETTR